MSHYIQCLFDNKGMQDYSYFNAFWDTFTRNIICLLNYNAKQFRKWQAHKELSLTLKLLYEC